MTFNRHHGNSDGHAFLIVEGGHAGLATEVLHRPLIVHRSLEDVLRLFHRPLTKTKEQFKISHI